MRKRWWAIMVAMAIAVVSTTAAWAFVAFSDVDESHPQANDIAYAVENGWFVGYPDGTFKPDRTLTRDQAVTVFGRAFPAGVSRADLATILRAGLRHLDNPHTDEWCDDHVGGGQYCLERAYWKYRDHSTSPHVKVFQFRNESTFCPAYWKVEVTLGGHYSSYVQSAARRGLIASVSIEVPLEVLIEAPTPTITSTCWGT